MSGGYFNHDQYKIANIAESIESLIEQDFKSRNDYYNKGYYDYEFSEKTKQEFIKGLEYIKKAAIYAHRIDWLLSGDDGEDSFHKRLQQDLGKTNT